MSEVIRKIAKGDLTPAQQRGDALYQSKVRRPDGAPPKAMLPLPSLEGSLFSSSIAERYNDTLFPLTKHALGVDPDDPAGPVVPMGMIRTQQQFIESAPNPAHQAKVGNLPPRGTEIVLADPHEVIKKNVYEPLGLGDEVEKRMNKRGALVSRDDVGSSADSPNPWLDVQVRHNSESKDGYTAGYFHRDHDEQGMAGRFVDIAAAVPEPDARDTAMHEFRHAITPGKTFDSKPIKSITDNVNAVGSEAVRRQRVDRPVEIITHVAPAIEDFAKRVGKLPETVAEMDEAMRLYGQTLADQWRATGSSLAYDKWSALYKAYKTDPRARSIMRFVLRTAYAVPFAVGAGEAAKQQSSPLGGLTDGR